MRTFFYFKSCYIKVSPRGLKLLLGFFYDLVFRMNFFKPEFALTLLSGYKLYSRHIYIHILITVFDLLFNICELWNLRGIILSELWIISFINNSKHNQITSCWIKHVVHWNFKQVSKKKFTYITWLLRIRLKLHYLWITYF